jgi:hypothetical protein
VNQQPLQPLQPWAAAWRRRMQEREQHRVPTERERTEEAFADFLSSAPVRLVVGFEEEPGHLGAVRQLARLSCGHLQSVWRDEGIRCLGCFQDILEARKENWLK